MNFMMKTRALGLAAALAVSGCAELEPLTEYRPIVDPERTNMPRFERDLEACRAVAVQVEADYSKRQQEQMGANIMTGLLVGAITGAVVGGGTNYQGELVAYGAASGMAAGAATNDYTHDLVTYGPRRIVDRCMAERGHAILNDIGRG
jgi:uncharacterized protein YcfJ